MVRLPHLHIDEILVFLAILSIYRGICDLTTFLTTTSPPPHHSGKNLTTVIPGGEGTVKIVIPLYLGHNTIDVGLTPTYRGGKMLHHHLTSFVRWCFVKGKNRESESEGDPGA